MNWIRNVREGHIEGHWADCGDAAGAICVTCGKQMPKIWDTVCQNCGATSCYEHSNTYKGKWYCEKCGVNLIPKKK